MSAEITKIIIDSIPNINVIGHPLRVAIIGGLVAGAISLIGIIGVHIDSKRMWRSEIFVKKMQEELVHFYDLLSAHIKDEYELLSLSKLLNNKFDYTNKGKLDIEEFYNKKLLEVEVLEEQFIITQPILQKSLKLKKDDLLKQFSYIDTAKIIYSFLYNMICEINSSEDLDWYDIFDIDCDECNGLQTQELKGLRDKFKQHCLITKIRLKKEDERLYGDESKNDSLFYNAYLNQIRAELSEFKKSISEYMFKEL